MIRCGDVIHVLYRDPNANSAPGDVNSWKLSTRIGGSPFADDFGISFSINSKQSADNQLKYRMESLMII